jgi:hypothetical protein
LSSQMVSVRIHRPLQQKCSKNAAKMQQECSENTAVSAE